jgi:hypothetical protein
VLRGGTYWENVAEEQSKEAIKQYKLVVLIMAWKFQKNTGHSLRKFLEKVTKEI